jgi:hypothetical protein
MHLWDRLTMIATGLSDLCSTTQLSVPMLYAQCPFEMYPCRANDLLDLFLSDIRAWNRIVTIRPRHCAVISLQGSGNHVEREANR